MKEKITIAQSLREIPETLKVGGDLDLRGRTGLTELPDNLEVGGFLDLSGCTGLTELPDNLKVGSDLDLHGCTGLTELPDNLEVGGDLDLFGCTGLSKLPDKLKVGGDLYLNGCTGLKELPSNIDVLVGGEIDTYGWTGHISSVENKPSDFDLNKTLSFVSSEKKNSNERFTKKQTVGSSNKIVRKSSSKNHKP